MLVVLYIIYKGIIILPASTSLYQPWRLLSRTSLRSQGTFVQIHSNNHPWEPHPVDVCLKMVVFYPINDGKTHIYVG